MTRCRHPPSVGCSWARRGSVRGRGAQASVANGSPRVQTLGTRRPRSCRSPFGRSCSRGPPKRSFRKVSTASRLRRSPATSQHGGSSTVLSALASTPANRGGTLDTRGCSHRIEPATVSIRGPRTAARTTRMNAAAAFDVGANPPRRGRTARKPTSVAGLHSAGRCASEVTPRSGPRGSSSIATPPPREGERTGRGHDPQGGCRHDPQGGCRRGRRCSPDRGGVDSPSRTGGGAVEVESLGCRPLGPRSPHDGMGASSPS